MIEVTQGVLKAGRLAAGLGDGWELQLALKVDGSVQAAQEAFGQVILQVERQVGEVGADSAWVGEWESAVLDRSLIIRVSGSEDFEGTLGSVRDLLQSAGVQGRIRVWEAARNFIPPEIAPMLCCRTQRPGRGYVSLDGR